MKRRRDSVGIIYEILLAYMRGLSKTRAVYVTNLNFRMMEEYLKFLASFGYMEASSGTSRRPPIVSLKGQHLLERLEGLMDLEREITAFRNLPRQDRHSIIKGSRIENESYLGSTGRLDSTDGRVLRRP